MKVYYCTCFLIIASLFGSSAVAQKKASTYVGSVKGFVFDSVHNYVLPSATLSVLKIKDSSLISYQLSNNFGAFQFHGLPVGTPLEIIASYTGYNNFNKTFTIPADTKEIDLKALVVERSNGELQEVVVPFIPPVRMNGDTLEFNADAFKLDSNAVVEDLLRKLPGITIWSDGVITANGKKINSVLVDGKPFLGGDTRVAIENLPKNAIDKIQVYQQKNEQNPLDSTTNVNIKLKANKKVGHFGKVGGGYGTDDRFEANASLNIYSPQTQIGIVAAGNNTNKQSVDINSLISQASYKGVGVSTSYESNFQSPGTNLAKEGGFIFQHDFIPDAGYQKNNRLSANYFVINNNNITKTDLQTITSLGGDSSLLKMDNNETDNTTTNHRFESKYEFSNQKRDFNISPSFNVNNSQSSSTQQSSSAGSSQGLQSTNSTYSENNVDSKNISLNSDYTNRGAFDNHSRLPKDYQVDYTFYAGSSNNQQLNKTEFISVVDSTQNKNFDRKYNKNSNDINQTLSLKVNDLKRFIFNYNNHAGIDFQFQNNLYLNTHNENNKITDEDTISKLYLLNNYLTNKSTYNTFNDMPGLNFTKYFNKGLANRYQKKVSINVLTQAQFYNQKNVSKKAFQNFEHSYAKFIANASIRYTNYQYGDHQMYMSLNYKASSDYPDVDQLAPLTDSSIVYYIQKGTGNLKPDYRQEVSFTFQNSSMKTKNTLFYNLNINVGCIKDNMVDSSIYDDLGRTIHYTVNANGNKYAFLVGSLNKAFKFKENQLQVSAMINFNIAKNPNYVNSGLIMSNNFNNDTRVNIYYSLKDFLSINMGENLLFSRSVQNGINKNEFKNSTKSTSLSTSINFTKKLSMSSNITYNRNTSSGSAPIDFTIWNASAQYRFLKGNNAEIKLSALDLLHQNTSIINYSSNNSLSRGTVNVLQQYLMVSISYFPRKFGKKENPNF